jgi:hypothetical protein
MDIEEDSNTSKPCKTNPPSSGQDKTNPFNPQSQNLWGSATPYDSKYEDNQIVQGMLAMTINEKPHDCEFEEEEKQINSHHFQN